MNGFDSVTLALSQSISKSRKDIRSSLGDSAGSLMSVFVLVNS